VSAAPALPRGPWSAAIEERLRRLDAERFGARLAARDPTLWGPDPARQRVAANRLGWLDSPARMRAETPALAGFAREVAAAEGDPHVVLLGMGGSSLAPEVLSLVFGPRDGGLPLTVLDDTGPAAVRAVATARDPGRTLFIVSSKSGGTVEVASFEKYFHEWVRAARGADGATGAGRAFVAITDPGSPLEDLAARRGYRRVFLNAPDIGGRYSALSYFGLVPGALLGLDLDALLASAAREAATLDGAAREQPGLLLGAALGELALAGRDKLTLLLDPAFAPFGSWIEQLVAESTGKDGRGIVPVVDEPLAGPERYGADRVFVTMTLAAHSREGEPALAALERAGHPVLRWSLESPLELGGEFLRWEIATATAGAVLGVDPFDEPNVTEAKQATREALDAWLAEGRFPTREAVARRGDRAAYAPAAAAADLGRRAGDPADVGAWARALLSLARPGDYVALLAYLQRTPGRHQRLEQLRVASRAMTGCATTLGYGPRYLHSTGQLHKGGADTGLFLLLTADDEGDEIPIPGERYGFGALRFAQAAGDHLVLERRGRRVVRLHLGANVEESLDALIETLGDPALGRAPRT